VCFVFVELHEVLVCCLVLANQNVVGSLFSASVDVTAVNFDVVNVEAVEVVEDVWVVVTFWASKLVVFDFAV